MALIAVIQHENWEIGWGESSAGKALALQLWRPELDPQDHVRSQPQKHIDWFILGTAMVNWGTETETQRSSSLHHPSVRLQEYCHLRHFTIPWALLRDTRRTSHWGLTYLECLILCAGQVSWGNRLLSKWIPDKGAIGIPLSEQRDPELLDVPQSRHRHPWKWFCT